MVVDTDLSLEHLCVFMRFHLTFILSSTLTYSIGKLVNKTGKQTQMFMSLLFFSTTFFLPNSQGIGPGVSCNIHCRSPYVGPPGSDEMGEIGG